MNMDPKLKAMTDEEVVKLLSGNTPFNRARLQFSNWSGRLENAHSQRKPVGIVDMRRMEFQAIIDIAKELGFKHEW